MKQSAARIRPLLLLTAAALAVLVLLLWSSGGEQTARANPELTVGIDLNPSTPSTYESCVPISGPGVPFTVDVFVLDIVDLMAFAADVDYDSSVLDVTSVTVDHFLGSNAVDASSWGYPGKFRAAAFDEASQGHSGSGVLARLTLQGVANGESHFNLDLDPEMYHGVLLQDPTPNPIGDPTGDTFFDGPFINEETTISVGGVGDTDGDGVPEGCDNCPGLSNPTQTDTDGDGMGDMCDPDDDNDGIPDFIPPGPDNCRLVPNPFDADGDGQDGEDPINGLDDDADTLVDEDHEIGQENWNDDPQGDVCDDTDLDGIMDYPDNCREIWNDDQADMDGDGVGDVCDPDKDGDGYANGADNCPAVYNPDQADTDGNGVGDACQDSDGDGWYDPVDNCPATPNSNQADGDGDGVGNACDNCQSVANPGQENTDGDALGDACDWDDDNDGYCDPGQTSTFCTYGANPCTGGATTACSDNCQFIKNGSGQSGIQCVGRQTDTNGNGIGDPCDPNADSDLYPKALEEGYGSKDCDASSTPEACDGTDSDGDTLVDEGFDYSRPDSGIPSTGAPNGIPDCTEDVHSDDDGTANPSDDDDDNDGTKDVDEGIILTDSLVGCDNGIGYPDWPPDFDDNHVVNLSDVFEVLPPYFGAGVGDPEYTIRRDLRPDGVINLADVFGVLPPIFGSTCTP